MNGDISGPYVKVHTRREEGGANWEERTAQQAPREERNRRARAHHAVGRQTRVAALYRKIAQEGQAALFGPRFKIEVGVVLLMCAVFAVRTSGLFRYSAGAAGASQRSSELISAAVSVVLICADWLTKVYLWRRLRAIGKHE